MDKDIILVGGGGHCRSVIEAVESSGRKIRGIIDLPEYLGTEVAGYKIIGNDDDIPNYVDDCEFIVTLGAIENAEPRERLHRRIKAAGGVLATIIASTAYVSPRAKLGMGTVVLHQSVVNSCAEIGESVIINTGAIVEHDSKIGDFTHISTGAKINGGCEVGKRCFVGSGSVLIQGIKTVDDVFVGTCSLLSRDAKEKGTYIGYPARIFK